MQGEVNEEQWHIFGSSTLVNTTKVMKRLLMRVLLLASTIAICASPAYSCWCPVHDVAEAFDEASAVFAGRVIQIEPPRATDPNADLKDRLFRIRFRVEKSWKRVSATEIEILSAQGRDCFAYPPVSKGERYLVYADPPFINGTFSKDLHMITVCNRTAHLRVNPRNPGRNGTSQFDRRDGPATDSWLVFLERVKTLLTRRNQHFKNVLVHSGTSDR